MGKASEIWKEIKPKIGEMLIAVNNIETRAEKAQEEAFKNGYDAACKDIDIKSKINAAYQKGLSDAWEAARTLWNAPKRKEIFGYTAFNTAITTLTGQEAIEKIRQYEQRQEEQDGLRQNIQTIVDQCGYTLDEIAAALEKMKEGQEQ